MKFDQAVEYQPVMELDPDIRVAMEKLGRMQAIEQSLPGVDCGSCGAPTCRALAEDVVRGFASEDDCIYRLREMREAIERLQESQSAIKE